MLVLVPLQASEIAGADRRQPAYLVAVFEHADARAWKLKHVWALPEGTLAKLAGQWANSEIFAILQV